MDFRMRSHKENKQNYNSMAEFPRHFEPLSPNGVDFAQTNRLKQIQGKLNNVMQSQRAESQANSSVFFKLEQRIDRLQHKMLGFDRDDPRISNKNQPFKDARNSAPYKYNNNTQDLAFFKQSTLSDLTLHREEIRKQNIKTEQIEIRQLRVEQELRDWMNNQKLELNMRLSHNEQLRGSQIGKQKKYQYQYDNIKSMVNTLEHKVQQELDSNGRGFMSLKQDFQHSLQLLREEMGREIKNDKEAFTKLVKDIKDSFQVLKDALGMDRQHVKQAIFQIQNNQQNSLNKSNRSVETLASTTIQRQQKIQKKMVSMKDDWNSFKLSANQKMQDLKTLVMNIQSTVFKAKGKDNYGDNFEALKEELAEWKKLSEQKNLNVFREISNAMKILRMEWRKEHDELSKDFQETAKSIKQIRQSINKRVDKELLSITQVVGEQFEALTLELEQINDFVALSKKETEESIAKELANVKESLGSKSGQAVKLVSECHKKMQNLQVFLKKQLKESSNILKDQIVLVQQNTKMQIQSLVTSITEDNQQWQKDLKGSIKALKESLTQQIQSSNSKQAKQHSQSLKKMQSTIEGLKKNIQAGLSNERSETVKQVSKVTEELTSLIGQWSVKVKKQRENGQNAIKQELSQIKKVSTQGISQVKQTTEDLKSKAKQKIGQDQKKILQLKGLLQQSLLKVGKASEEQSGKLNKKIESLKSEFQGKLKMSNDKILLQINSKKQLQQKAKQDQSKKYTQFEKKITEASSKVKSELTVQLSKVNKAMQEELGKNSKKVQLISSGFKKDLQTQVEKERKFCSDEIVKVKGELETKIKAKDEKNLNEINAKRDAQTKQKEEDLKTKFIETEKKTTEMLSKLKTDILTELSKSKTANIEELTKLKGEVDAKIKTAEQVKVKKEADSKAKENELKQKENQLKNRGIELDKKIELAKKDIQKSTSEQMNKLKVQVEAKAQSYNQQIEAKVRTAAELTLKTREEQKTKFQELNKNIEEVKQDVNKKIAELKGVSLVNMKAQQEQANKAQQQKLLNIKSQLTKAISQSSLNLQNDTNQKIIKLGDELKKEIALSQTISKQAINKVQANLFTEHQKNKAVYDKMSSDILDIAESMMAVIAEMKPAAK